MIGKIKGTLVESMGDTGLIETSGGVFYEVHLNPVKLNSEMPAPIEVYTYLQVRDDALVLFGFETRKEYELFTMLLSVSGVGPKTAYTVTASPLSSGVIDAVRMNDVDFFSKIPGLGKKTAMKIILELSQKLKEDFKLDKMFESEDEKTTVEALTSLGFKVQEARTILKDVPKDLPMETRISEAIRKLTAHKK